MAQQRNIKDLQKYLRETRSSMIKGYGLALIETTQEIESLAKQNVTKQFTGRNNRTLTGRLLNSVFSGFERRNKGLPTAFVGVRGIPYGAIHEFGGVITPVKAKNLWIKNHDAPKKYKRLTPREFIKKMREGASGPLSRGRESFSIIPSDKGPLAVVQKNFVTADSGLSARSLQNKIIPLFFLRKKVTIPKRPYLTPAIVDGIGGFHRNINKQILNVLRERFFGR